MLINYSIYKLRQEKHMTQRQLARKAGISTAMVSFIERGQRRPTLEVALMVAKALGTTLEELIILPKDRPDLKHYLRL